MTDSFSQEVRVEERSYLASSEYRSDSDHFIQALRSLERRRLSSSEQVRVVLLNPARFALGWLSESDDTEKQTIMPVEGSFNACDLKNTSINTKNHHASLPYY